MSGHKGTKVSVEDTSPSRNRILRFARNNRSSILSPPTPEGANKEEKQEEIL